MTDYPDPNDSNVAVLGGVADVNGVQVPLSPEDAKALLQAAQDAADKVKQDNKTLMHALTDKLETVIKARRPVEQRMVDDMRQYEGESRIRMSKQDTTSVNGSTNVPPRRHTTRVATDEYEARLADMLVPTNDYAFDLKPTPDDEWQGATKDNPETGMDGVPQAPDAVDIEERCSRMKKVICDQLSECKFGASLRKAIRDAARLGTGILSGPVNTIKVQRRFRGPNSTMTVTEIPVPEAQYIDLWNFYPDMVPSLDKAEFAFVLHLLSRREVEDFKDYPSFDSDEIDELLKEEPELGPLSENLAYRNQHLQRVEQTSERYAVWRYTGTLTPKEAGALSQKDGMGDLAQDISDAGLDCTCETERIPMVDMWFCQGHVLKARLRPIERDYRIPYYNLTPLPADDTPFGYSLPYLGRDGARVLDAAWQIALHNASVSAGPIIVLRDGKIEPRDRSWEFRGPKIMSVTDPDVELADCLMVENIPNNLEQALEMVDRAEGVLQEEMMMKDIMQGDGTNAVPTASGLALQMNSASILMKRAAACADDDVFLPLITRMYWWNMLFNDRADIKGDYDVVPLGQSKQMVKDIQVQHLQAFMAMTAGNPKLAPYVNDYGTLKHWATLAELPIDQILNDKDKTDAAMAQQPNPALDLANANVALTQAKAHKTITDANVAQVQTQHELSQGKISPQEAELQMQDYQTRREEAGASVQVATIKAGADAHKADTHAAVAANSNATTTAVTNVKAHTDLTKAGMQVRVAAEKGMQQ